MRTRANVSEMIRNVAAGDDYVIQDKSAGKPIAIVLPYRKYEDLIAAHAQLQAKCKR